jgi:single-stranded DNA-binding protein
VGLGHVTFTGHLAKDARLGEAGGRQVANFTVGTSRRKNQNDKWIDVDQTFIECAVWQKFEGDTLPQRLAALEKGAPVIVEGSVYLKTSESQGKTYRDVACHVDAVGEWWKPKGPQQGGYGQQPQASSPAGYVAGQAQQGQQQAFNTQGDQPPF